MRDTIAAHALAARLRVLDDAITTRHTKFLDALEHGDLTVADFWHTQRDELLLERHRIVTEAATAAMVKAVI